MTNHYETDQCGCLYIVWGGDFDGDHEGRELNKPCKEHERRKGQRRRGGFRLSSDEWGTDCMKWRGRILTGAMAHWCNDWDGLPIDETTPEWDTCVDMTDRRTAKERRKDE